MSKGQAATSTATPGDPDWDDLIGRVYDVALDPSRYEDLLDHWESTMSPLRKGSLEAPLMDDASILSHFNRAEVVLERMAPDETRSETELLLQQFDSVAALIVGERLAIRALNGAARQALGVSDGAALDTLPIEEQDRAALSRQIARMLAEPDAAPSVFRVRSATEGNFIVFHMRRVALGSGEPVVVAVTSDLRWPEGFSDILTAAFGLSGAETDVVRLLIECCSAKDIANTRGRSVETVRAQIKAIMAKTETSSQVELVRLTLSMMDIAGLTADTRPGPRVLSEGMGTLEALPFQTTFGADGRQLDYLEIGDPQGRPVLYLHMDFGFARWTADAEAEARAHGLRVIAPIRAGYGHSDPIPKKADFGVQTAQDIAAVLDATGVGPCPVIALAADHLLALELEVLRPGQVTALLAVAGVFPFTRPAQYERMHKWHRFIQAAARYTPQVLPFLVKSGFHLARRGGKRSFVHSVFGQSEADIATFEDPQVFEAMITGSEICLSEQHSAHDAFSRQALYEHAKDRPDLVRFSEGKFPFISFNGDHDPGVHPDTVDEFQEDYPWIEFRRYDDAGQLLFFRHWRDVLTTLQQFL